MAGPDRACGAILVVEDDESLRACILATLRDAGFECREAATGEEALAAAAQERHGLAIIDVNLPGVSGYEVCHRLLAASERALPVIFVSGERTEPYDRVAGLMLGADDYLAKPFAPDELLARVRCVLRRTQATAPERMTALTNREREVLTLLAHGRSQTDIAAALVISPKTVGTHIEHILEKLDVRSRAQAIALAYRDRLVAPV